MFRAAVALFWNPAGSPRIPRKCCCKRQSKWDIPGASNLDGLLNQPTDKKFSLWWFNIATENGTLLDDLPTKIGVFLSYVKLQEGSEL